MNIPTKEQIERACIVAAKVSNRAWPEDFSRVEMEVWRAQATAWLAIVWNRDFIERAIGDAEDDGQER